MRQHCFYRGIRIDWLATTYAVFVLVFSRPVPGPFLSSLAVARVFIRLSLVRRSEPGSLAGPFYVIIQRRLPYSVSSELQAAIARFYKLGKARLVMCNTYYGH